MEYLTECQYCWYSLLVSLNFCPNCKLYYIKVPIIVFSLWKHFQGNRHPVFVSIRNFVRPRTPILPTGVHSVNSQSTTFHYQKHFQLSYHQSSSCIGLLMGWKRQIVQLVLNFSRYDNRVHSQQPTGFFHKGLNQQLFINERSLNENVCLTSSFSRVHKGNLLVSPGVQPCPTVFFAL